MRNGAMSNGANFFSNALVLTIFLGSGGICKKNLHLDVSRGLRSQKTPILSHFTREFGQKLRAIALIKLLSNQILVSFFMTSILAFNSSLIAPEKDLVPLRPPIEACVAGLSFIMYSNIMLGGGRENFS